MNLEDEQERRLSELEQNFARLQALQSFSVSDKLPSESDSLKWDNELGVWTPGKSGGALGFTQFDYRWDLPPDSTPGPGHISRDGDPTDPSTVTTLYLSKWDSSGDDYSLWFAYMKEGDWLNIYDRTDSNVQEQYDITGPPVVNGDVFEVPVVLHAEVGTLFVKNQHVSVFWRVVGDTTEPAETVAIPQYFVGSIYKSIDPTDPGLLFGGTWVPHAEGRMLVGVDPLDPDFATPGLEGGEKDHTHSLRDTDQAPGKSVAYAQAYVSATPATAVNCRRITTDPYTLTHATNNADGGGASGEQSVGSGLGGDTGVNDVMSPYTTVYVWVCTVAPVNPPPYQSVSFGAYSDTDQILVENAETGIFDIVDYDLGGHYDPVTSSFTVPFTGIYVMGARAHYGSGTRPGRLYCDLQVNDVSFRRGSDLALDNIGLGTSTSIDAQVKLTAGDVVTFKLHATAGDNFEGSSVVKYFYGRLFELA